jgi:uncharacterized protein (TIRG00374 family)
MTKKKVWTLLILCSSICLLFYLLKDLKLKELFQQISKVDLRYLAPAGLSMFLSAWFRNLRWMLLFEPLGYKIRKGQAFTALLLSYPANLIVPQSSFFVRASYLKRMCGVPFSGCLGTIVAEKFMDGLVVFGLFFLLMFSNTQYQPSFSNKYSIPIFFVVLVIISVVIFFFLTRSGKVFLHRNTILEFVHHQWLNFKEGLLTTKAVKNKMLLVFYSLFIWLPYFGIFYFLLKGSVSSLCVDFQLPIKLAVMANIGWIFPTQGGVGSFHFFVSSVMTIHGFENLQAVFFSFLSHSFIVCNDIFWGLVVMLYNRKTVINLISFKIAG